MSIGGLEVIILVGVIFAAGVIVITIIRKVISDADYKRQLRKLFQKK